MHKEIPGDPLDEGTAGDFLHYLRKKRSPPPFLWASGFPGAPIRKDDRKNHEDDPQDLRGGKLLIKEKNAEDGGKNRFYRGKLGRPGGLHVVQSGRIQKVGHEPGDEAAENRQKGGRRQPGDIGEAAISGIERTLIIRLIHAFSHRKSGKYFTKACFQLLSEL